MVDPPEYAKTLLRENAEMPEIRPSELEAYAGGFDAPALRQIRPAVPAVSLLAIEACVGASPLGRGLRRTPQRLRTRTRKRHVAKALKFAALAGIDELVTVGHLPGLASS